MLITRPKDLLAGAVFVAIGILTFFSAQNYEIGTANRMGPGYLPAALGLVLIALGIASIVNGLRNQHPDPIEHHAVEPLALILLAVVAFAFLITRAGLVPAICALVVISCARRLLSNPIEVALIAAALSAFCVFLFVYLLGMAIPLFW